MLHETAYAHEEMNNLRRDETGAFAHIAAELRVSTGSAHSVCTVENQRERKQGGEDTILSSLTAVRQ